MRSRNAHAWVEVLDPLRGWYTADASPADLGIRDQAILVAGVGCGTSVITRKISAAWSVKLRTRSSAVFVS